MSYLRRHITDQISITPLAMFRVIFGAMMLLSIVRFAIKGWIYDLYVLPTYHFTYFGFDWVKPLSELGMYGLFTVMALSAAGIMLGWYYRLSSILFFLSFTYVELIDKTNYLNHYYFVSLVSFLMIFLPAHRYFSLDVLRKPDLETSIVPAWTINIIKFQLGLVYFYAGLAKLNTAWLFDAMPLKIWLPANSGLPVLGTLFNYEWTAYAFSWFGAIYDLSIVFFLLYGATRLWAYGAVLAFHLMTAALFQIGMFPYIMILSTLVFFSHDFHQKIIESISTALRSFFRFESGKRWENPKTLRTPKPMLFFLSIYVVFQLAFPFRYLAYPGDLFWTEQGYRFSWRVMLMEKAGYTVFNVSDTESGKQEQVMNYRYLTENQEKMMSTQPDMILQFAHFLEGIYLEKGFVDPEITVESYVTLNGKRSRLFIDPSVDLTKEIDSFAHKSWVLPLNQPVTASR